MLQLMNIFIKSTRYFSAYRYGIDKHFLVFVFFVLPFYLMAQVPEVPANTMEQHLEAVTESNDDAETEDDSFLQAMQQFLKEPVNLNTADATILKELVILSPLQIQNIIAYRNLFGNFINIYGLQAIPGWNIRTLQRLRPFVTVSVNAQVINPFSDRLNGGASTILLRVTQVLEQSKGYTSGVSASNNFYPGSPHKLLVRYKYQYKIWLQYGVTGEKDAGEQFFKDKQQQGFDFYSAHLFARNIGIIKSLALGDFTINIGQGLSQLQNLAFKKNSDVTNIKRKLAVLRPYNSVGEINFHRGIGITLAKNNWETTLFASYKKTDANFIVDTLNNEDYISSLQTSGLHRTKS